MYSEGIEFNRVHIGLGEAAKRLGISRDTLYRMAKIERKIRFIQYTPNGRILFDPRDIEEFHGEHIFDVLGPHESTIKE
jgi:excisionase family DNA binding protein